MIGLCAPTYDPAGHLVLPIRADGAYQARRRGSVTATLDGEVATYDGGFAVGDATVTATWPRPTPAELETLRYLIALYPELIASLESGCYAVRAELATRRTDASLSLRLIRRLDA